LRQNGKISGDWSIRKIASSVNAAWEKEEICEVCILFDLFFSRQMLIRQDFRRVNMPDARVLKLRYLKNQRKQEPDALATDKARIAKIDFIGNPSLTRPALVENRNFKTCK